MEPPKKNGKERTPNFSKSEVELLMDIIVLYKEIIENKKTDKIHWSQKNAAWSFVEKEFNAKNGGTFRSSLVLKTKYENIKKTSKQKFAAEKRSLYMTGGGPEVKSQLTPIDEMVSDLLGDQIEGLTNSYDDDKPQDESMETGKKIRHESTSISHDILFVF